MVETVSGQKQVNYEAYNQQIKVDPKTVATGQGVSAKGAAVPDAGGPTQTSTITASLSIFISGNTGVDTDVLLLQVAVSMRDTEATSQKAKINTDQEAKKAEMKEKDAKLEEAAKKMEEAERKRSSGNIFDKIALAFQWLGAILAVAVAAIAIATGVGAVAGALLMAAAVTAIVMAVDATVKQATGLGIAGNLVMATAEMRGLSPAEAKTEAGKADMGFTIALAVTGIVASVANPQGAVSSAFSAGKAAVTTGLEAGKTGMQIAKEAVKAAFMALKEGASAGIEASTQGLRTAQKAIGAVETVNTMATTTVTIGATVVKTEGTVLSADATKLKADAKRNEAMMEVIDDMIDMALSRLKASGDRFNAMLDSITDGMQDRSNTLSRASFSA